MNVCEWIFLTHMYAFLLPYIYSIKDLESLVYAHYDVQPPVPLFVLYCKFLNY